MADDDPVQRQLKAIEGRFNELFDEIGLLPSDRDRHRQKLFEAIEQALEGQVAKLATERDELKGKCEEIKESLNNMLECLGDVDMLRNNFENSTACLSEPTKPPYTDALKRLTSDFELMNHLCQDRLNAVQKPVKRLKELSSKIDSIEMPIGLLDDRYSQSLTVAEIIQSANSGKSLKLSQNIIRKLDQELNRWENEYKLRKEEAANLAGSITGLMLELGSADCGVEKAEITKYKDYSDDVSLNNSSLHELKESLDKLQKEKQKREEMLQRYHDECDQLWVRLEEDPVYVEQFLIENQGLHQETLDSFSAELERLLEKKKQFTHVFIEHARQELENLWEQLYYSDEEISAFTESWNDEITDAALEAHEAEVKRLNALLEQRKPVLALIEQYKKLQQEADELEAASHDASRLLSRGGGPGRLLREEKMRKRIARLKPKLLSDLKVTLEEWEVTTGSAFLVDGIDFLAKVNEEQNMLAVKATPRRRPAGMIGQESAKPVPVTVSANTKSKAAQNMPAGGNNPTAPRLQRNLTRAKQQPLARNISTAGSAAKRELRGSMTRSRMPLTSGNIGNRLAVRTLEPANKVVKSAPPFKRAPNLQVNSVHQSRLRQPEPLSQSPLRLTSSPYKTSSEDIVPLRGSPNRHFHETLPTRSPTRPGLTQRTLLQHDPRPSLLSPSSRVSPTRVSPTRVSPTRVSPTRLPPSRLSPTRLSPTKSGINLTKSPSPSRALSQSSNWEILPDQSSDEEFSDPGYLKWREQAMDRLARSPGLDVHPGQTPRAKARVARESEFDWNKHAF